MMLSLTRIFSPFFKINFWKVWPGKQKIDEIWGKCEKIFPKIKGSKITIVL